jgi:hypothetical protein
MQALPCLVHERAANGVQQLLSKQISDAVKFSSLLGSTLPWYWAPPCAGGGISAAVHAQVPEPVLLLQSGH